MRIIISIILFSLLLNNVGISQITLETENIKCKGGADGKITASVENAEAPIKYVWSNGANGQTLAGLGPGQYCVTATDANNCTATACATISEPGLELDLEIEAFPDPNTHPSCGERKPVIVSALAFGGTPPYEINTVKNKVQLIKKIGTSGWVYFTVIDSNRCVKGKKMYIDVLAVACPKDPNDILGPNGYSEPKWVSINDTLNYTVRFENDAIFATAPAQQVIITHEFEPNINPYSFRLGSFGFGPYVFEVPPNLAVYQKRIDLISEIGLELDVSAGIDVANNRAIWTLSSIDPATGQIPLDPFLGFLPVNDTLTSSGEGFVSFYMQPDDASNTGDTARAQASIIFDVNEAIETNIWKNVIDALPPSTNLSALSPITTDSTINLTWTAMDDSGGSGLASVEIYARQDSTTFEYAGAVFGDTSYSFDFIGELGSSYDFYTIGVDNTGNREEKSGAETSTSISPAKELDLALFPAQYYCIDDTILINWSSTFLDSVDLAFSRADTLFYQSIARVEASDSNYVWPIPDSLANIDIQLYIWEKTDTNRIDSSILLAMKGFPQVDAGMNQTICGGELATLIPSGANEYFWSPQIAFNNQTNAIQTFFPDSTQKYFVTGTDVFGCIATDSIEIDFSPSFTHYVYEGLCTGDSVLINGNWETMPGSYVTPNIASNGCDSSTISIVSILGDTWLGNTTVYVDSAATGNNDGSSWGDAFTDLQDALCLAYSIDSVNTIWVSKGSYYPTAYDFRIVSYNIQDSIQIFGGFTGTEDSLHQRNPNINLTRLSGDLGIKENTTDNSFHILRIDPSSVNSLIDGFIIENGNADGLATIDQNGAGLLCEGKATLSNVIFENHISAAEGAVILNMGTDAKLTILNCEVKYDFAPPANYILNSSNAELYLEGSNSLQKE